MGDKKMTELEIEALTDWLIRHGHNEIETDDCIQTLMGTKKDSCNVESTQKEKYTADEILHMLKGVNELYAMDSVVHSPLSAAIVKAGEAAFEEVIQELLN